MAATVTRGANNRIGTCPHGLPMGACPICNGMGGGGSVKKDNKPKEMSYNECYAVWQMMKAQKAAHQQTVQLFAAQDLAAHLNKIQEQINALKTMALNSSLPKPLVKAIVVFADAVLTPAAKVVQAVTNTVQNIANAITKTINDIKQKIVDIADKLTAMLGEAKAAIQKKIDEKFKDIKKKIFNLFGITGTDNEEDDELKRIEEEKRLFELNTAKEALFETKDTKDNMEAFENDEDPQQPQITPQESEIK